MPFPPHNMKDHSEEKTWEVYFTWFVIPKSAKKQKQKTLKYLKFLESKILNECVVTVKNLPAVQETCVQSLDQEDPLEEEMATHSSILAWTEEPGGLQSLGSKRAGQ